MLEPVWILVVLVRIYSVFLWVWWHAYLYHPASTLFIVCVEIHTWCFVVQRRFLFKTLLSLDISIQRNALARRLGLAEMNFQRIIKNCTIISISLIKNYRVGGWVIILVFWGLLLDKRFCEGLAGELLEAFVFDHSPCHHEAFRSPRIVVVHVLSQ